MPENKPNGLAWIADWFGNQAPASCVVRREFRDRQNVSSETEKVSEKLNNHVRNIPQI